MQITHGCGDSNNKPNEQPKICGQVVEDGNISHLIAGATVEIIENNSSLATLYTDSDGSFCFASSLVSEANFYIKVTRDGYATAFVEMNNTTDLTQLDNILLTKLSDPVTITSTGGTIDLENNVSISFPVGAIDEDILVQATLTPLAETIVVDANSSFLFSIDLNAKNSITGAEIDQFNLPVTLKFPIYFDGNLSADDFVVYMFDEENQTLVAENLDTKIENGYLQIQFRHFSHHIVKAKPSGSIIGCVISTSGVEPVTHSVTLDNGKTLSVTQPACTRARVCRILIVGGGGGIGFVILEKGQIKACCDGKKYCSLSGIPEGCNQQTKSCTCAPTEKTWCPLTEGEPECTSKNTKTCPDGSTPSWCPEDPEPACPTGAEGGGN